MLDEITPVLLTYNEAPNIGRTLERLRWARDIVVVDSFSDDETVEIVSQFPNTRVFQREFDDFAAQWQFGINETGISAEWVLALDADFNVPSELVDELAALRPPANTDGYKARVTYGIHGKRLRSGLLPPLMVLYRRAGATCLTDGHTYRVSLNGDVAMLHSHILHDDRKPLGRWLQAQHNYAVLEGRKLLASDPNKLGLPDRIRRLRVIAPIAVLLYCLVYRGGILDGWAGFYYAFQRMFAELLLSLYLLENDLSLAKPSATEVRPRQQEETGDHALVAVDKQPDAVWINRP